MPARLLAFGRDVHARVKSFFDHPLEPTATPIELLQATLDLLETKVQPSGRGACVFPYSRIVVSIAQPATDRAALDAVFSQLESRLQERLRELKCAAPGAILTQLETIEAPDGGRPVLSVECFDDVKPEVAAPPVVEGTQPVLRVAVVKGACEEAEYEFRDAVVAIGRTAEPIDAMGRVRRNHIAFLEAPDGVTETVGRAHARLQFDRGAGGYLLFNESSSNPTFVLRGGRSLRVPPRDPRGMRVESGDQIQLGRALLRVTIVDG